MRDVVAAARAQQADDQIVALANILTGILAARRGEPPVRVTQMPPDDARRALDHARRTLAERDPLKVAVAHYRGIRALHQSIEELMTGGQPLAPYQADACRIVFERTLQAYQAALVDHRGAAAGGTEASGR